ncbi:DUF1364 domain-containing protein [Neisseria blantyrii]|uniref:DUF1364 domain-containing protein n=1 Tax=Neisseria blantyrii TaxID=2830647 RepID=UPI00265AAFDA|nr:DUF1364 domain-containing protein [Neisseria blantyrii]
MSKITQSARGERCQIRFPGICNHDPETTVFAHYRLAGTCGMGIKPSDLLGAFACSACHDAVDERVRMDLTHDELRAAHAEGVMRTLVILEKEGLVKAG